MRIADSIAERILSEFSSGNIYIEIGNQASILLNNPEDTEGIYNFGFRVRFNGDFWATPSLLVIVNMEYQEYIDKEREKLYDEINEMISESQDLQVTAEYMKEINLLFEEARSFYKISPFKHYQITEDLIRHSRYESERNNLKKPILENYLARTSSSYFIVQLQAIQMIIKFLDLKIESLKALTGPESSAKSLMKKKLQPIDSLDRYQSALMFHYLEQAGAIKSNLSNKKLGQLIGELTDHSSDNLRNQCFNKIQEIKMGDVGNKLELIMSKTHNLDQVKEVMREMIKMLERDLRNNRDSQKK